MKLTIEIDMENDAFQPDPGPEIARVLRWVTGSLTDPDGSWGLMPDRVGEQLRLRDHNGNTVGHFSVTED